MCRNYGVPARTQRQKPGPNPQRDPNYKLKSTNKGLVPGIGCHACGESPPLRSNAGIAAEIERLIDEDRGGDLGSGAGGGRIRFRRLDALADQAPPAAGPGDPEGVSRVGDRSVTARIIVVPAVEALAVPAPFDRGPESRPGRSMQLRCNGQSTG